MEEYKHGIYVKEEDTELVSPVTGTAALPIVFGTAPINLIENPYDAVNKPILCNDFTECEKQLGYSENFKSYTLCMSMDAHFKVFKIAPVIFVNVLDPNKHVKKNDVQQYTVVDGQALVTTEGILLDTLKVSNGDIELTKDVDYLASFNDNGYVLLTIVSDTAIAAVTVESTSIAPESVTYEDIIGGYDASTGVESGIETVRQVYPRFGKVPGLLLAPGWVANNRCIMEKAKEFQKNIYFCFIDYARAFDCVDHKKLWKILKEMGIPEHLTCLLRNLYAGQEATVRTGHGTTDWFQIGKGLRQDYIWSPCLFNFYAENIMRNWTGRNTSRNQDCREKYNNLRYADDTTLMAESEEELKILMKVKEESEKGGLKLNIQKTKIRAYGPSTLWEIDGETVETVSDFIFLGSKITADGDCSHEIKRGLLLGRKVMTNLDSIFKSRDITLPTKVRLVKAMVFPVVMYGCESWTVKKAER